MLAVPHQIDLYKTALSIAADSKLEVVFKPGQQARRPTSRSGGEDTTTIEVEAVGPECGRSARATATFNWDVPLLFYDGFEAGDTSAWSTAVP